MDTKKKHFSDRDKILRRTFKMFVNCEQYTDDEYHDFCHFAKGKSESKLLTILNERNTQWFTLNRFGIVILDIAHPNLGSMNKGENYNQGKNKILSNEEYNIIIPVIIFLLKIMHGEQQAIPVLLKVIMTKMMIVNLDRSILGQFCQDLI